MESDTTKRRRHNRSSNKIDVFPLYLPVIFNILKQISQGNKINQSDCQYLILIDRGKTIFPQGGIYLFLLLPFRPSAFSLDLLSYIIPRYQPPSIWIAAPVI